MSLVFDRAVDYYDRTRALKPEEEEQGIASLIQETGLQPDARVLELGIGTGRIAIPLARHLQRLTGVDLSFGMMSALRLKTQGAGLAIDLARADAVRLPFPDNHFELVYAVHVLHVVAGWREAVAEARRVLQPGGYLVVNWHRRDPNSVNRALRNRMRELAREEGIDATRPGAQSEEEIAGELQAWGPGFRRVVVSEWQSATTPRAVLEELGQQIYSETWLIPRPIMDRILPRLGAFAEERFGSLDAEVPSPYSFAWLLARKD